MQLQKSIKQLIENTYHAVKENGTSYTNLEFDERIKYYHVASPNKISNNRHLCYSFLNIDWDITSGCIWDINAINRIKEIKPILEFGI